jgi:uncharacterized protein (DUF4213/DUF364 family)
MKSNWKLYDTLIEGIPGGICVREARIWEHWIAVESSEGGMGLAMRVNSTTITAAREGGWAGMPLNELARAVKSWNFVEAGCGLAAINAYYNHPQRASALGIDLGHPSRANEAFQKYRDALRGKKAAVIGHFPYLEELLGPVCRLSILERAPQAGDYPDSACEYLLPEEDYVFITGSTLVNKTAPRLLELSRDAYTVLVGPSVPLAPALFETGIDDLSGFVVLRPAECFDAIERGGEGEHFKSGTMVNFKKA